MAAVNTFTAVYNSKALVPQLNFGWDTNAARRSRYATYTSIKNNNVYSAINMQAPAVKLENHLYKFTDGLFNPAARFVNLMVAYIAAGEIDMDSLTMGSIPIVTDNEAIRTALIKMIEVSRWAEYKGLYIENGVNLGDTFIKVVDDR